MTLAYRMILQDQASGQSDDSLCASLVREMQQLQVDGPRSYQTKRFILFLGGLVLPIVGLAVAWVWFSGKPRTG